MTASSQTPGESVDLDALAALAYRQRCAGQFAESAAAYRQILALRPDVADVWYLLGDVLLADGKPVEAAPQFERALALKPGLVQAHNNLGRIFFEQGNLDLAAAHYQQVVALRPDQADAHYNLGFVLARQGKRDQALARFEQALALRPDHAQTHYNLGNLRLDQGKLDEAAAHYEQALALHPEYAEAYYNLGIILGHQGKLDQSATRFEQAVAVRPDYPQALNNLGVALREQRQLSPARQVFERLEALQPDSPYAQLGLALSYLVEGDYERGWPAYEARLRMPGAEPQPNLPRWIGQPLEGRSLLLLAEQGLGDTFHFLRYARLLKRRGARVVLACPAVLGRLLASHPDVDEIYNLDSGEEFPQCDFYLPLLSAPGAFRTDASTIPCEVPYISADPDLVKKWRRELAPLSAFKIGIVWQGSRGFLADSLRSIALAQFAPLAALPGVRLISLQKGFGSEQIAAVDFPVLDLSDRLDEEAGPLMDTAAVIRNLDLVLTPDTAIGHLAGALGAPVWLALQFSPNWRWLHDRDDSPWYPTMRLFRQTTFHDWAGVFERITRAVQRRLPESDWID